MISKTYSMNIYVDVRKVVKMLKLGLNYGFSMKGKMWDIMTKGKDLDKGLIS